MNIVCFLTRILLQILREQRNKTHAFTIYNIKIVNNYYSCNFNIFRIEIVKVWKTLFYTDGLFSTPRESSPRRPTNHRSTQLPLSLHIYA